MNKDEIIKEMIETIAETWIVDLDGNPHNISEFLWECDIERIAKDLYDANCRIIAEDEIVLKKSEYEAEQEKAFLEWKKEYDHNCLLRLEVFELEKELERYKNKAKHYYNECKLYGGACYIDNDLEDNNE